MIKASYLKNMYQLYKMLKKAKLLVQWYFKKLSFMFEADFFRTKEMTEDERTKAVGRAMLELESLEDSVKTLKLM